MGRTSTEAIPIRAGQTLRFRRCLSFRRQQLPQFLHHIFQPLLSLPVFIFSSAHHPSFFRTPSIIMPHTAASAPPPIQFVRLPAGITAEQAHQALQVLQAHTAAAKGPPKPSPTTRKRKQRRLYPGQGGSDDEHESKASHWRMLNSLARIGWARWFSLPDEDYVNQILAKALGQDVFNKKNQMLYYIGYGKIRAWSRQWQCDILKRLTEHVSPILTGITIGSCP